MPPPILASPRSPFRTGLLLSAVVVPLIVLGILGGWFLRNQGAPRPVLADARQGFRTQLLPVQRARRAVQPAPADVFATIRYPSPNGPLAAYVTPDPGDGKRRPAIVWITGGDSNSLDPVWLPAPRDNDQTAAAYRRAGIVMMFASLRGGNDNPGIKEGFLGEVDDVVAAATHLRQLPYVDPDRVYLGGHSTGGTLALLVAECPNPFRAVFAFGPVDDVGGYGPDSELVPVNLADEREVRLRSPGYWLHSIATPTWVLEGTRRGNISSLRAMARRNTNPRVGFVEVAGATHFTVLAPLNELLARKILLDQGPACSIALNSAEAGKHFAGAVESVPHE